MTQNVVVPRDGKSWREATHVDERVSLDAATTEDQRLHEEAHSVTLEHKVKRLACREKSFDTTIDAYQCYLERLKW